MHQHNRLALASPTSNKFPQAHQTSNILKPVKMLSSASRGLQGSSRFGSANKQFNQTSRQPFGSSDDLSDLLEIAEQNDSDEFSPKSSCKFTPYDEEDNYRETTTTTTYGGSATDSLHRQGKVASKTKQVRPVENYQKFSFGGSNAQITQKKPPSLQMETTTSHDYGI